MLIATQFSGRDWQSGGCNDCDDDEVICFKRRRSAWVERPGLPVVGNVRREDWPRIVEAFRSSDPGRAATPDHAALSSYNVCPLSVFDRFTWEAARLYFALGGLSRISAPADYYRLPAVYRDVVDAIEETFAEIKRAREAVTHGSKQRQG